MNPIIYNYNPKERTQGEIQSAIPASQFLSSVHAVLVSVCVCVCCVGDWLVRMCHTHTAPLSLSHTSSAEADESVF